MPTLASSGQEASKAQVEAVGSQLSTGNRRCWKMQESVGKVNSSIMCVEV